MERSGSSGRGKKSSSEKPKQPQRGLGVAQLERIRLRNQMMSGCLPSFHSLYPDSFNREDLRGDMTFSSSSLCGLHPRIMMGYGDSRPDMTCNDFHYSKTARISAEGGDMYMTGAIQQAWVAKTQILVARKI